MSYRVQGAEYRSRAAARKAAWLASLRLSLSTMPEGQSMMIACANRERAQKIVDESATEIRNALDRGVKVLMLVGADHIPAAAFLGTL